MKISVVINTLNAQETLEKSLKSIAEFADEMIICDDGSSDQTLEIARKYTKKIFTHKGEGFVEKSRNFAVGKATGDWVLVLDADEELSKELGQKLEKITKGKSVNYVSIPRKNIIFGKWIKHSGWWPDYNIRFFKKGRVFWTDKIHNDPKTEGNGLTLEPDEKLAVVHNNYDSISQFLNRLDSYTAIEARQLKDEGYKFDWRDLISKPFGEFLSRYFASEGYRDGLHGLALALLQTFSFFVTYLKVWETEGFDEKEVDVEEVKKEIGKKTKEARFWVFKVLWDRSKGAQKLIYKLQQKLAR